MRCELTDSITENTTGSSAPAAVVQSPKPRDVNGSAVHAALPKLLAFSEVAEARPRFERVQRADLFSTAKDASARVRVSSDADADQSARWVAARFPARGNHAAVLESVRATACAGAAPVAIAAVVALGNRTDMPAAIALLERLVAVTEAAVELGVAVAWIQAAAGNESVVSFGRIQREGQMTQPFPSGAGERLVFLGETATDIGGSRYLSAVHGLQAGAEATADYAREKRLHDVMQTLAKARVITAAHSVSAGGLLVAVCGMLLGGEKSFGARLDLTSLGGTRADALLFGETHGCAVVAVAADRVGTVISEAHMHGVSAALIGEVAAEPLLELKTRSLATEWRVAELQAAWAVRGQA